MADTTTDTLTLNFSGRIIDHLGIQMYQSPTAALAELVANAWDAKASIVEIRLPDRLGPDAAIMVTDNGSGMSFTDCQERFLRVGYCRRDIDPAGDEPGTRPVLGRKGIGKFAGFGIAKAMTVDTVHAASGERTKFTLFLDELRGTEYVSAGKVIDAERLEPLPDFPGGTKITLSGLTLKQNVAVDRFRKSLARKFLLLEWADGFGIAVNGQPLPQDDDAAGVQFAFPKHYKPEEIPVGMAVDEDGWGVETLADGNQIRWRMRFYANTIDEEELRGVSVFAGVKIAQSPFYFNLAGGLGGQHGQEYMSGQVKADYLDQFDEDVISTERQRISWGSDEAAPLQAWGRDRVKQLLRIWKERRGADRVRRIEDKLTRFGERLSKLSPHEQRIVKSALTKLAQIPTLSDRQFEDLSLAVLKSWEGGRLISLISDIGDADEVTAEDLVALLDEANVLSALGIAEVVTTKVLALEKLAELEEDRALENNVRDFIAKHPYLLHPQWETFRIEIGVMTLLREAAADAGFDGDDYKGRIDLALRSRQTLLVVEFMRPGLTADFDHLQRCQRYMAVLRDKIRLLTSLGIDHVEGLVVADKLGAKPGMGELISTLKKADIVVTDWHSFLETAAAGQAAYLDLVIDRAPHDERIASLRRTAAARRMNQNDEEGDRE